MVAKRLPCAAKRALRLLLVGASVFCMGVCASDCIMKDTCEGDGDCRTPGGSDAAASDTATGDALDSPLGDTLGAGDASGVSASALDGGTDAADVGAPPDAGPAAPFLGSWTRTGTESFLCSTDSPDAPETADPGSIAVTFSQGPGPTEAGQVDVWFDDGIQCALPLFVDQGVARLVSAPQTCNLNGGSVYRKFTSVQVSASAAGLAIREIFTDRTMCQYQIDGVLRRQDEE